MGKRIKKKVIDIPREIMEEILYKLPVKTLLRFKCVSKPWRSLISSKSFVKQHLKKSRTYDDNTDDSTYHDNLIFSFSFRYRPTSLISLGSCSLLCNEPVIKPNYIDNFPSEIPRSSLEIVGSCNGLVLIKVNDGNKLVLWNPSTRQVYKSIPVSYNHEAQFRITLSPFMFLPNFLYGLGYEELKDEYKVVCIKVPLVHKSYETLMYSSKTGSWKKIGNFDKGAIPSFSSAKFVSGRFHWLARDRPGRGGTYSIVSLDLLQEEYETVAGPNCMSNYSDDSHDLKLEDLGGYISLVVATHDPQGYSDVSVWAMMEYGKRESWTKIWTLADFVVDPIERRSRYAILMPLWLKKNGDVAVAFGSDIVVYNGKNEVRKYQVDLPNARIDFILYHESLVSPFVDDP